MITRFLVRSRYRFFDRPAGALLILTLCAAAGTGCFPLPAKPDTPVAHENSATGPGQKCERLKPGAERRKCFEGEFNAADHELNAVYQKLRSSLPKTVQADLKNNSRAWIRMKEYNCGFLAEAMQVATHEARRTEFLRCVLGYTHQRAKYLRRAFGREGVAPGTAGEYDDGFSGGLRFAAIPSKRNAYHFSIKVVRGPTAHIGEISGEVALNTDDQSGVFAERPECGGRSPGRLSSNPANTGERSEPCCRLDFRLRNQNGFRTIEVKETNCGSYHGARAYFDGLYRKIK